jgi:hypothetical protein
MKFTDEQIKDKLDELGYSPVEESDYEERYCDELDDLYNFEQIGGPFSHMLPSRVLEEIDPIMYRCGLSDFFDSYMNSDFVDVDDEYYSRDEYDEAIDALYEDEENEDEENE